MENRISTEKRLRSVGLRPTRQRVALGNLLFEKGDGHFSAELLHEEAKRSRILISLATVYNTLHQFTKAGLLRVLTIDGPKTYFDTNVSDHHHFFIEDDDTIRDIVVDEISIRNIPELPANMEIVNVDVVIRLRRRINL